MLEQVPGTRPGTASRWGVPEIGHAVDQAVSFARPLLRRLLTIARPARVRIRRRNPCTRERRRLLGWNVRFPLVTADSLFRGGLVSRARCRTRAGLLTAPDSTGKVPPRSDSAAQIRYLDDQSRLLTCDAQIKRAHPASITPPTGDFCPQLWITMWTTRPDLGHGDSLTLMTPACLIRQEDRYT